MHGIGPIVLLRNEVESEGSGERRGRNVKKVEEFFPKTILKVFLEPFMKLESLNNTHKEKLCFTLFSTRIYQNRSLAASDLFHMFIQPIKFYTFHCHILKLDSQLPKKFFCSNESPLKMMKI